MAEISDYTSELRHMILSFRVSELHTLLGFAGRNRGGRKDQLQSRALDLLKLRSAPIHMKIKELYKRHPNNTTKPVLKHSSDQESSSNSSIPSTALEMKSSSQYNNHSMSHRSLSSNAPHVSIPLDYSSKYGLPHSGSSSYPVHPDVKFKRLPFYQIQTELLKPASLVPTGTSRFQEANFVFHLTPQQAHDIAMSRDLRPGAKIEYGVQVQMRFCLLETSCEQEDNFPPSICVKVNGKMCPLPNPIPTNKPGVEPKRPSRPVNVTLFCKLSPTVANQVNVSWASEYGRGYAIGIFLVKRLTSNNLLTTLRAQGIRNADHTRALIKEKLKHDADSEIATTSLRVSLLCPLGKMRMQIPCRASTCTHLQCFDGSLYIQMNEKKATWICPVCDRPASFDSLVIDGLFMEIFQGTTDCNEIQFHEDGSWSPLQPKKETHMIDTPVAKKAITVTSAVTLSSGSSSSSNSSCSTSSAQKSDPPKFEVVDLTLESSDEDDEPPIKSPALSISSEVSSSQHTSNQKVSGGPSASSFHSSSSYGLGNCGQSISMSSSGSANAGIGNMGHSIGTRLASVSRNPSSPVFRGTSSPAYRGPPSPAYRDMPIIDSPSQVFVSPYSEFLQSSHAASLYSFPGYDLFNLLGAGDLDNRQVSPYQLGTNIPSSGPSLSITSHNKTSQPPSSPDVISLD